MSSLLKKINLENFTPLTKEPVARVQLAKYAGASGDFNPIHIDEEFAKNSPLKGVIAHGMLSMGSLSQFAEQIAEDVAVVTSVRAQFRQIVHLGDVIQYTLERYSELDHGCEIIINGKNEKDEIVIKGTAVLIEK